MLAPRTYEERVDDAATALLDHNMDPFVKKYLKRQKPRIPASTSKPLPQGSGSRGPAGDLQGEAEVQAPPGRARALSRPLAGARGCQHVFLFRLPSEGHEELLAELRDPTEVKRRLGKRSHLYNAERLDVVGAEEPELVEVVHCRGGLEEASLEKSPPTCLFLEWVETRKWMKKLDTVNDEKAGRQTVHRELRRERTANFFYLDLQDGTAELRLQKLHTDAKPERIKLREAFRALVSETLGIELPEPVVLAPAIRQAADRGRDRPPAPRHGASGRRQVVGRSS